MAGTYYADQAGLVLPQPNVWLGLQACTTTFPQSLIFIDGRNGNQELANAGQVLCHLDIPTYFTRIETQLK